MAAPRTALLMAALCAVVAAPSPAGNLEPSRPPGPTMKTLLEVPPTWSQDLSPSDGEADGCNSSRFTCVLNGVAVLDNETGLVWHRAPFVLAGRTWTEVRFGCAGASIGSRGGWRAPSLGELTSLLVNLPPDAPFQLQATSGVRYWTMTGVAGAPLRAWAVTSTGGAERRLKTEGHLQWCLRGPGAMTEY